MLKRKTAVGEPCRLSNLEERLITLLIDKELYGLQIAQAIFDSKGRKVSFNSLYLTLHKLEEKGCLSARWGRDTPEERGRSRRRYYRTTALGENALNVAKERRQKPGTRRASV